MHLQWWVNYNNLLKIKIKNNRFQGLACEGTTSEVTDINTKANVILSALKFDTTANTDKTSTLNQFS